MRSNNLALLAATHLLSEAHAAAIRPDEPGIANAITILGAPVRAESASTRATLVGGPIKVDRPASTSSTESIYTLIPPTTRPFPIGTGLSSPCTPPNSPSSTELSTSTPTPVTLPPPTTIPDTSTPTPIILPPPTFVTITTPTSTEPVLTEPLLTSPTSSNPTNDSTATDSTISQSATSIPPQLAIRQASSLSITQPSLSPTPASATDLSDQPTPDVCAHLITASLARTNTKANAIDAPPSFDPTFTTRYINYTQLYTCTMRTNYAILGLFYDSCTPHAPDTNTNTNTIPKNAGSTDTDIDTTTNVTFCCDPGYAQPESFDTLCVWGNGTDIGRLKPGEKPDVRPVGEGVRPRCFVSPIIHPKAKCIQV